ncbi:DUF7133 domain-containing protein [Autumnicola edwardsiae]|uniref:DUF7133 domain-containing protein n=1 Tax=Autumnicola edwardsiae TaxID=3075594 RepID=A0ABU3CW89_9FLAO|nr:hypothetical protein [Zunongwangia sp. F297]MDT0650628.1 hypothetical protein [Zunongwangia sp. F297]
MDNNRTNRFASLLILACFFAPIWSCGDKQENEEERLENFYTIEDIEIPEEVHLGEVGGLDFMPNGNLVACFHRGEVMVYDIESKKWQLFAEGLHDPLGISAISNHEILVMQRPELTKLSDLDRNGTAEEYLKVTDGFGLSGNYHEFAYGPVKDAEGNLFISLSTASNGAGIWGEKRGELNELGRPGRMYSAVPYRGWVMKITPEGKIEPYAMGFRSPNGIGFDHDGNLFVTDNQGDWLGTSKMYYVEEGKFYGHVSSLVWKEGWNVDPLTLPVLALDSMRTKAAILFPHNTFSNSPTEILPIPEGKFGPYGKQLLVGEMNYPKLLRVMLEEVKGSFQGATINFLDSTGLSKGNHRMVFGPDKKSLYVGKTAYTWVGGRGIQKINYNGGTPFDILNMNLSENGFKLTYTRPLAPEMGDQPEDYEFVRYYYEYHRDYGSPKMDLQPVKVKSVKINDERTEVFLELEEMVPGYIYDLKVNSMKCEKGLELMNRRIYYTLNNIL